MSRDYLDLAFRTLEIEVFATNLRMLALLCSLLLTPCLGWSNGSTSGRIVNILAAATTAVVFISVDSHINKPACSTVGNDWALDVSTVQGRAVYALILTAQAQSRAIQIIGTNDCSVWGDRETISGVSLAS